MSKQGLEACELLSLAVRGDDRGSLIALESDIDVGFPIARVYYIYGTVLGVKRGFHAHRVLKQLAIAVSGSCTMRLDDGRETRNVRLDRPDVGLTIGPMVWREMSDFSTDCVLVVLASAAYDESDYIRDYTEFRALAAA